MEPPAGRAPSLRPRLAVPILGLGPTDLTQARMDSAKFQDHGQYDLKPTGESAETRPDTTPPTRY